MKFNCKLFFLLVSILVGYICTPIYAKTTYEQKYKKSIVFVLDASGSMKTNDSKRLATDSIAQLIYSLPSDFQVGFVAYNSEVTASCNFVDADKRSQIMEEAEKVEYKGYSNAGTGLEYAVEMLRGQQTNERYVVMLSDGEILMERESDTEYSIQQYQKAIQCAQEDNIKIHVIGLGDEMKDMNSLIFSAAEETNGKTFYTPQALNIQNAIDTILTNELGVKQSTIAMIDTDGDTETVSVELPYVYADNLRVLITGTEPIINLNTNFQSKSARQINGLRYSLIEISKPSGSKLELSFQSTKNSHVRVNIIAEYHVTLKGYVTYEDEAPQSYDEEDTYYNRTADIKYSFCDVYNSDIRLWTQDFFNHAKIVLRENGKVNELALSDGFIETNHKVLENQIMEIEADYSYMPVNVIDYGSLVINLEGPPIFPVEKPNPPYVLIGAALLCIISVVIVLIMVHKKRKPIPLPPEDRPEPSKYSYSGKLNIYITMTSSGYDIPPLSYNLFRLPSGKVISMREILDSCDVKEEFSGAGTIYFKAGAGRSLIIINNSDCTIMKNREILMKNKSYQLPMEAKVDITFEDEISELTLHYKDLKPFAI